MTWEAVSGDDLTLLVWGLRAFLVLVNLLLVGILMACWWVIAGRAFAEFRRGWRADDLWLPFLRDERGEWGPLVSSRRWGAARAEQRGTAAALTWRWGFWMFVAVVLTIGVAGALWSIGRVLVRVWV